jgi:hypothetical protein
MPSTVDSLDSLPGPASEAEVVLLQPGDVMLTRSRGIVGWAIRTFTRRFGESRTKATHTGIVVESGPIQTAVIVEALSMVRRHRLWDRYAGGTSEVAVFRPLNLSEEQIRAVVLKAESYVGRRYGYLKLIAHWADWLLQGAYVFRRLTTQDDYPICSWVVAYAFAEVGKHFDVEPGAASPDDIWDFVTTHPEYYAEVLPLGLLEGRILLEGVPQAP